MLMLWRITRILALMAYCMVIYAKAIPFGPARRREAIDRLFPEWGRYLLRTFKVSLRVFGREHLPPVQGPPRVFLCNHQSQIDIPTMTAGIDTGVGFVAKKELGRIPILAFWMRAVGCVFIDRSDKFGARKALEKAAATLDDRPLVVFPEGTRSKTGKRLPIKMGGIRMALLAGAQVIPSYIHNSRAAYEAYDPNGEFPIPVQLRFFPAMDTSGLPDEKASYNKIKEYLEECWALGEAEALTNEALLRAGADLGVSAEKGFKA
jgi:1-acyl-sn-glycerol-3-phosphate acyltransferase